MKKHGKNSLKSYLDKFCILDNYDEKIIFINGEETHYRIRSNGVVISTEYQGKKRKIPHEMIGGVDNDGYRLVTLTHNHIKYTRKIHRLVAEYFIPNPFKKPEVNHKDGNKFNNDISNLEWVYSWENAEHAALSGLKYSTNYSEYIHLVCQLLETNEYSMKEISRITGVEYPMVVKIHSGYCYKHISAMYDITNYNTKDHYDVREYDYIEDSVIKNICLELVNGYLNITEISRKYNVSVQTVTRILNHETRQDITSKYSFVNYNTKGINQFIKNIKGCDVKNEI